MSRIDLEYSWLKGGLKYRNLDGAGNLAEATGYHLNGNLKFRYYLVGGKIHGACRVWYENGQAYLEESYVEDNLYGARKRWHENGVLGQELNYRNGYLDGPARSWYENGVMEASWGYSRGSRQGPRKEWYENGVLRLESNSENDRLHGAVNKYGPDGKLIQKEVYVNGVRLSARMHKLLTGNKLTAQHIVKISNTAVRRICLEEFGYARFLKELGYASIDKDGDQELVKTNWYPGEEPLCLVKVKCPSTGAFYTLRVPPKMRTVKEAVAWTFGFPEKEYLPAQEA